MLPPTGNSQIAKWGIRSWPLTSCFQPYLVDINRNNRDFDLDLKLCFILKNWRQNP